MKKYRSIILSLFVATVFVFTGCSKTAVTPNDAGTAIGSIGDTFAAANRDFSIISASKTDSFGGYTPIDNEQLIEIVIKTTNTGTDAFTLSDIDYQLQWGTSGFTDALGMFDADGNFLDSEILLEKGKSVESHYLFSVPDHTATFTLCYLDSFSTTSTQTLFYCDFTI